jgi:GntR family transcriptional regulator
VRALPPGSRIPTEQEVARTWGVSRFTASRAIAEMANEGLIYRRQGAGSFAAEPPLRRMPENLLGFSEAVAASGHVATHRLLGFAPVPWQPGLPFRPGEPLILLDRLRFVDGIAVARHRTILATRIAERIGLTQAQAAAPDFSLYRCFAQHGLAAHEGRERLTARLATREECELLRLATAAAVMAVTRQSFARDGTVLDAAEAVYDARRYAYESRLVRQQAAGHAANVFGEETSHATSSAFAPDVSARLGARIDLPQRRRARR